MTTTTQQIPSNPALDFADAALAETDGAREIIYMLHDIAQGVRENATTQDRINATNILMDRGLGKCPKQAPVSANPTTRPPLLPATSQRPKSNPNPPGLSPSSTTPCTGPSDPRPAPVLSLVEGAQPEGDAPISPEPFDPYSIQQQLILETTDNCRTLVTVLTDIYRAPDDDPRIKESHRVRAGRMLIDRIMAMYTTAVRSAAGGLDMAGNCPQCSYVLSSTCPEHSRTDQDDAQEQTAPDPKWLEALAKIQQMKDDGILTPDPNAPEIDHDYYMKGTEEEIRPYADEVVAKYRADLELRLERRKNWPKIEERRRKKLEQIYPSHSEDDSGDRPET